jgi:hypothetical protein
MNHLTNIYKHKCEQLQEQLNNLTRMLNEAPPPRVLHTIPDGDVPFGGTRFIPNGPDGNPRGYGRNDPTIDPAEIARREAAAAHAALVRRTMGTLMDDLKILPFGSWGHVWEIFTDIEREAFIALFGSQNPVVLEGMVAGVPAQFIRYMTPNGEWAVMYNTAMPLPGGGSNGHPNWIPLTKGNTPFGNINPQGFLPPPPQLLNNTPEDFVIRPPGGGGTIGGGGLGQSTGGPVQ